MAGASLWVLRARFFRLDVRRFGTAIAIRSVSSGTLLLRALSKTAERAPAAISFRRTVARTFIQICAAASTKTTALLPAFQKRGCGEKPLFAYRRTKVQLGSVRRDHEHVGIVRFFSPSLGEQQMQILPHRRLRRLEASPAGHF